MLATVDELESCTVLPGADDAEERDDAPLLPPGQRARVVALTIAEGLRSRTPLERCWAGVVIAHPDCHQGCATGDND